jgi:Lon protease-like protein
MILGRFPVFPLRNPCFPGHRIQLRIFEDRYVRMLKDVEDNPFFVISLISSGDETGAMATPYRVGTLAEFEDMERQGDFLIIRPKGRQRVYLETFDRESKPYLTADCAEYRDEGGDPAPPLRANGLSGDRLPELEAEILNMIAELGPEESRSIRDLLEGMKVEMDKESFSLFLCGCLHLPPIYMQRLLESRSLPYRTENALNLLARPR